MCIRDSYRKEVFLLDGVDLDRYQMLDLYRDAVALFEKVGMELPKFLNFWYSAPSSNDRCSLDCGDAWVALVKIWDIMTGDIPIYVTRKYTGTYYYIVRELDSFKNQKNQVVDGSGTSNANGPQVKESVLVERNEDEILDAICSSIDIDKLSYPTMSQVNRWANTLIVNATSRLNCLET